MTQEEAKDFLTKISYALGNMSVEYLTEKDGERMREAIKALEQEPCDDVISREDALQALCKAVHKNDDAIPCSNQRVSCLWNKTKVQDYAEEILKLPFVTPKPRTGRWVKEGQGGRYKWMCSNCGTHHRFLYDYCPSCGARMQEVQSVNSGVEE